MDDWITTEEACKISNYHPVYLRQLLRLNQIQGKKWGRDWMVNLSSLQDYIKVMDARGLRRGPKPGDEQQKV